MQLAGRFLGIRLDKFYIYIKIVPTKNEALRFSFFHLSAFYLLSVSPLSVSENLNFEASAFFLVRRKWSKALKRNKVIGPKSRASVFSQKV